MSQLKKLERDINFDAKKFNLDFEEQDSIVEEEEINNKRRAYVESEEEENRRELEKKHLNYSEDLIINMKEMFFFVLEALSFGHNPFPQIFRDEKKLFTFSLMIIILGALMLFLSNLMINEENN